METREQLESSRARYARETISLRRDRDRLYERVRSLESGIRRAAEHKTHEERSRALQVLLRRIPAKPRPTMRALRAGRRP